MAENALLGQVIWYGNRIFRDKLVTGIEKDTENRGIDTEYGSYLTYGLVTLPVDQQNFVAIQQGDHWVVVDTI
jgi:hypothetical protein